MVIETTEQSKDEVALCSWCSIPLGSANAVRERVCIRCYGLLINAGLKEAEIFSREPMDDEH